MYTIKCPDCGKKFGFGKGSLMCQADLEMPERLKEDYPVACPTCGRRFVVTNAEDRKYITDIMFVD